MSLAFPLYPSVILSILTKTIPLLLPSTSAKYNLFHFHYTPYGLLICLLGFLHQKSCYIYNAIITWIHKDHLQHNQTSLPVCYPAKPRFMGFLRLLNEREKKKKKHTSEPCSLPAFIHTQVCIDTVKNIHVEPAKGYFRVKVRNQVFLF